MYHSEVGPGGIWTLVGLLLIFGFGGLCWGIQSLSANFRRR